MKTYNKVKPVYTVDITNANTVEDVKVAFSLAKHNAGVTLTNDELIGIIKYTVGLALNTCNNYCVYNIDVCEMVRKPWYKRFWNWITRKKN